MTDVKLTCQFYIAIIETFNCVANKTISLEYLKPFIYLQKLSYYMAVLGTIWLCKGINSIK